MPHLSSICPAWPLMLFLSLAMQPGFSQNYVYTYAGDGSPGYVDGDASVARFNTPFGIALGPDGSLYLADGGNHAIRKVSPEGVVSTYAGTGVAGHADGPASAAQFNSPINLCFGPEGNMYVSDFQNQRIRKITPAGEVSTIAGDGFAGYEDGPALRARFNYPRGICIDNQGNLYVGDSWNHRIRKISAGGTVSTWAGGGTAMGVQSVGSYVDAAGTDARFYTPTELSIDEEGNIYAADAYNHRIRKISPSQIVTTLAGSGGSGPNAGGFQDGPGDEARFDVPTTCHVTPSGGVFVGDGSNNRVRKITPGGYVSTFAGTGEAGFQDGPDTLAQFDFPRGIALDTSRSRLYVVDYNNHAIRYIQLEPATGAQEVGDINFQVYPNPFNGQVTITLGQEMSNLAIAVSNATGQVVYAKRHIPGKAFDIGLASLPPGLYYLSARQGGKTLVAKKLIKR
ncbi:MAG: T9SS type A sorting domain-containing protein [Phaeodactylibacter sp.]|nr:T9SS type A sorting domain-containing protein [Phaeodactylibacter sp.]